MKIGKLFLLVVVGQSVYASYSPLDFDELLAKIRAEQSSSSQGSYQGGNSDYNLALHSSQSNKDINSYEVMPADENAIRTVQAQQYAHENKPC